MYHRNSIEHVAAMVMRLGNYLLVERLNQGGMADVFLAKTFGFGGANQIVAVKCIRPEIAEDPAFVRMFIDEAKLAVLLDHTNIAQTYELGRIGTTYFMAMEYVLGRDLKAMIDRARTRGLEIPPHLVLHVISQVCEGLDYAHRKTDPTGVRLKIVHRDVSPQNVLVSYSGEVKLIDFGIAKAASQASRSQAGVLKGKYGYMSPEQVRGMPVDHRSDVFAAGVLFWEMLTCERLFPGASDFSVLEKVRYAEVYPPTFVVPKTHVEIEEAIMRALTRDPDDRFSSASDMHDTIVKTMLSRFGPPSQRELASFMQTLFEGEQTEDMQRLEKARLITKLPDAPSLPSGAKAHQKIRSLAGGMPDDTDPVAKVQAETRVDPPRVRKPVEETRVETPTEDRQDTPIDGIATAEIRVGAAHPTEVRGAYPRRHRARDFLIVLVALTLAVGVVTLTWLSTRSSGPVVKGGVVIITTPKGAQATIDNVRVGVTPFSSSTVEEGTHELTLTKEGFAPVTRDLHVVGGRVVEIEITLPPAR